MSNFTVYKSSAGSGKTFNLVKNYLKIALNDSSHTPQLYKNILAITFTNKAAGEMKQRVIETLKKLSDKDAKEGMREDLLRETGLNAEELAKKSERLLNEILHHYGDFSIGTIDSFIHRVVRTFALDLRLPVNFSIETDPEPILTQCIDELLKKIGEDDTITKILLEFSQSRMEENKNWKVNQEILSFAKKIISEENPQLREQIRNTKIEEVVEAEKRMSCFVREFSNNLSGKAKKLLEQLRSKGLSPEDFYYKKAGIWNYFEKIAKGNYTDGVITDRITNGIAKNKWLSEKSGADEFVKNEFIRCFHEIEDERIAGKEKYFTYLALLRNVYSLMVIAEIEKILFAVKQEENIVFISEFNRMISEVVVNEPAPFIFERLGEHYKHYLLDEFQDTSALQWKNLLPLLENSLSNGNFNLVVGDGKQSIYRWRGGEVKQFADLPQIHGEKNALLLEREKSLIRNYKEEILQVNYRSKEKIILFNNALYEFLKEKVLPDEFQNVYSDCQQSGQKNNEDGFVSLDILKPEQDATDKQLGVLQKIEEYVVKNIQEYGYHYSDITILTRKKKHGKLIADYLLAQNIPIVSRESLLLKNNSTINFLVSLLHLIREEFSPVHEANVIQYLCKNNLLTGTNLHLTLQEFQSSGRNIFTFLKEKNISACDRENLNSDSLFNSCAQLIRDFRLHEHASVFIQFFMDEVLKFSHKFQENLSAFLEWWDKHADNCSAILPEGTDAINIMTIHSAKGLQFPVVIFAFADWEIIKYDNLWVRNEDPEVPQIKSALVKMNSTLELTPFSQNYEAEKNKQILDNINLLYVATTRPENHLHIIGQKKTMPCIDSWMNHFGKEWKEAVKTETGFTFGKMIIHSKKKPEITSNLYPIQLEWRTTDNQKLVPVYEATTEEKKAKEDKRIDGILFHLAMSKIYKREDVEGTAERLVIKGHCDKMKAQEIEKKIISLFNNPNFSSLFEQNNPSLNEPEVFTAQSTYRPDRIVFTKQKTRIIDYKTGHENSAYHSQLENYARALQSCGYGETEKIIVYVEEEKIECID
jgi:ATP-dependent exoDNAse (exonuclease V) beta subunit